MKALVIVTKCERGDFGTCDALLLLCRSHCAFQTVGEKNMSQISEVDVTTDYIGKLAPATPGSRWRNWLLRVAITLFVPLLLLLVVEAGLRIGGVGFPTDVTTPCTVKGRAAHCYNLFFAAPFFPPGMIKTPQVYAIRAVKAPNAYRIFVLGESAAMGDPDPAYGFSRYLDVMLREQYPDLKFEIVNTGSVAINSHVTLPIARGLAKFQPDLFIIYSGNNEVVGPYGPGTALTSAGMTMPVIRGSIFYHSTRIGQLLTQLGTQKKEWGGMAMFLDKQIPASSPLMKYAYENFDQNLRDTIAVVRSAGARVIVSTVATNLKDCAPFASMHRDKLTPEALQSWSSLMQQGAQQEDAGSYADALKSYRSAATIDDQYAELEFRIGRALEATGDSVGAREHFLRARDLDTLRFRADTKINDINRSVAGAIPGVELVDADAIFSKESRDGITGSDLVYEHVHLTPNGSYLLAKAMFLQIASKLPSATGHPVKAEDAPSQAECERLLAFTRHDHLRVLAEMQRRLQEPPFTNQLNHSDQVLRLAMLQEGPDENPNGTAEEYQWAITKRPDDRVLHYKFGLFLFPYATDAAVQQLELSQPFDGFPVLTPDGRPIE